MNKITDSSEKSKEQFLSYLRNSTPARVIRGRAGTRPLTKEWLEFRLDHALARDAVDSKLSKSFLESFAREYDLPQLKTLALNRQDFVLNPPLGKETKKENLEALAPLLESGVDVQIVISDGLSAHAVERNLPDIYPMLMHGFKTKDISFNPGVIVHGGRVAIADQIAHHFQAKVALNLIGERPGLSCAESLSAYITYNPGPHTISSDRTVISNIHQGGTPPVEASAFIVKTIERILEKKVSGVKLQKLG
jgi:ethanolamine ammonia-lyase small subunit